jgi:hypothetical protein
MIPVVSTPVTMVNVSSTSRDSRREDGNGLDGTFEGED